MNHYCTLFDYNYLSRGLSMYSSLMRHDLKAFLYVFAFDEKTVEILKILNLPNLRVVTLAEFENPDLLRIKSQRTPVEYCWTCTPAVIKHSIEKFNLKQCTYVDADLYFFNSPEPIFQELGDQSVLITDHRYTSAYDKTAISGKYCVQFMTFKADQNGLTVLNWWYERCLEWCYSHPEKGKFGDQKYLDDWTTRFQGVHVLQHLGGGLAPWNIQQYDFFDKSLVEKTTQKSFTPIFYHFHQLKISNYGYCNFGDYDLSSSARRKLYFPYMEELLNWESRIKFDRNPFSLKMFFKEQFPRPYDFKIFLIRFLKRQNYYYLLSFFKRKQTRSRFRFLN